MANLHQLLAQFHHFREEMLQEDAAFFTALAKSQNPHTLVIACCDSRVDPAVVMGCRPGELFVVRSVAALVPHQDRVTHPDAVISAVEYGVKHLEIRHIIVMGHSGCGGIHGLMHPSAVRHEEYISHWVGQAAGLISGLADEAASEDAQSLTRRTEEGAVLLSVDNLMSYPWIAGRVADGSLAIHALYYDLHGHCISVWNHEKEDFAPYKAL